MLKFVICTACVLISPLLASSHLQPGEWGVTGEYLYLKPSVDDTYFVVNSPSTSTLASGKEINNEFNFSSGYRVGLGYAFCGCNRELGLFYTQLNANHTRAISGTYLSESVGVEEFTYYEAPYAGTASSKVKSQYQRVDGLLAQTMYQCDGFNFRVILGVEYANLDIHQNLAYVPTTTSLYTGTINQKSTTSGAGPEIGVDFDYDLCQVSSCLPNGLSLNVFSTGSLLLCQSKSKVNMLYTTTTESYPYDVTQEKTTRIVPALHVRLSLNYDFCVCNKNISIGAGYEFNTYIKGLANTKNAAYYGGGITSTQYNDYSLQGFFASLSCRF